MIDLDNILSMVSKPGRYTGGEWNSVVKDWETTELKLALAYPDIYEIGMSNLGLAILYDIVNGLPYALAERVYAPWPDMEQAMRRERIPLFSLESRRPVRDFDLVGFSLGYELTYTNVLNMLSLAGIPLLAAERTAVDPLIIGGGSCALNPEPVADYFDLLVLGEAEEALPELLALYRWWRSGTGHEGKHRHKEDFLRQAARLEGIYVPSFYVVDYQPDGTINAIRPTTAEAKQVVRRRIVDSLPKPLTRPIVPYLETVHDRAMVEIQRGCTRGCRFCQAGIIYRPVRERSKEEILAVVEELLENTGYNELSLVSLSSSDYPEIEPLVGALVDRYRDLAISLPSLRIDSFSVNLAELVERQKKTGFTFAPEAGTQRLRDVINKGVTEDDLLRTAEAVFSHGWTTLKLYFMIGLPTETMEDVQGIVDLVHKVQSIGRQHAGRRLQLRISVSTFVPKAHSPFQWVAQETAESLRPKHELLQRGLHSPGIHLSWHDPKVSAIEAVLSRGDRKLGDVVRRAWELGCVFDAWSEHFRHDLWLQALQDCGLSLDHYAHRQRALDEVLPWSHLSSGVSAAFLRRECERGWRARAVSDCRQGICGNCGLQPPAGPCATSRQKTDSQQHSDQPRVLSQGTECRASEEKHILGPHSSGLSTQALEARLRQATPGAPSGTIGVASGHTGIHSRCDSRDPQTGVTVIGEEPSTDPNSTARLRVTYSRSEPCRYVPHLDLIHLWEKALRRAGLPLAYSQGFSPHPKIFIALPLPVGVTSEAELMEIGFSEQLTPEYFAGRVAHQLPPGISVGEVREAPGRGKALQALVRAAEYRVLVADERPERDLEKAIDDLLSAAQLPREWVREKGVRRYDLRPLVVRVWLIGEERGYWSLGMVLRAGPQGAGRPEEVLASLGCTARARLIHRVRLILEEQDE